MENELKYEILYKIKYIDKNEESRNIRIEGYTREKIENILEILFDEGYFKGIEAHSKDGLSWIKMRLTLRGLDDLKKYIEEKKIFLLKAILNDGIGIATIKEDGAGVTNLLLIKKQISLKGNIYFSLFNEFVNKKFLQRISKQVYKITKLGIDELEQKDRIDTVTTGANMKKQEVIKNLEKFREKFITDVVEAYKNKGSEYGAERYSSWRKKFVKFLNNNISGESKRFEENTTNLFMSSKWRETEYEKFMRLKANKVLSFIDSLKKDIEEDEWEFENVLNKAKEPEDKKKYTKQVFIVYGHDKAMEAETARFLEKMDYEPIILHEQPNKGKTIIEKIEKHSDVGFAIVLYTPDDLGKKKNTKELNKRARQNVIFEHGLLIGKLGRERVVVLLTDELEIPTDISGIIYIKKDNDWEAKIAREMKAVGYEIDFNKTI